MIEYLYTEGAGINHAPIKVRLDGKTCGVIKAVPGGFQYIPKGLHSRDGGKVFDTVTDVQKSLNDS